MALSKTKEILLHTRMTDLGLGSVFNKYFLRFPEVANKKLKKYLQPLEPAITLAEFFEKNSRRPKKHGGQFKCAADGTGFSYQSAAFRRLREFLIANGFNGLDWAVLFSSTTQGNLFPLTATKTSDLLPLSITSVCMVKTTTAVFSTLQKLFPNTEDITIAQLLATTKEDIDAITGSVHHWKISYDEVQAFRRFIEKLQAKLGSLSFTKEGNPFMEISFKKPPKSPKLPKKMGRPQMPLCKASHLPIPGKPQHYCPRLNWIQRFGNPVDYFSTERWYGTTATTTKEQAA